MKTKLMNDDEIDLLSLFKILWINKWKIIATTSFFLIIVIIFLKFKNPVYEIKIKFYTANSVIFSKYIPLNILLTDKDLGSKIYADGTTVSNTYDGFSITKHSVMNMFIDGFYLYEELVQALKKNEAIKNEIKNLNKNDQKSYLFGLAKSFVINREIEEDKFIYQFKFNWHDPKEGKQILSEAVNALLLKVKIQMIKNINILADVIETRNNDDYEKLYKKFLILKKRDEENIAKKILLLKYHIELAKVNTKVNINLNNELLDKSLIYLKGEKVLAKEVEMLLKESDSQIFVSDEAKKIKFDLEVLKNDVFSKQLRSHIKVLEDENSKNFIIFNDNISEIKSLINEKLFIIISLILGTIIGSLYALISNYRLTNQKK